MSLEIEARYLTIDWQSEGVARTIEVAPVPLEIESRTEGGFVVESTIFNDFHPWLGICLGAGLEEMVPVFVTASGQEIPLLQVADPRGGGFWWLRNDGWDHAGKRHLSELQRSPGIYNIRIGDVKLRVENRLSSFGRADIQAYVDDFRGDLLWMIMNDAAGATATGKGTGAGTELANALEELHAASQRVLASPAVTIREGQAPQPIAKLRPNTASFRDYVRNPAARLLTGRVFDESADTAENRYLRHILAVSLKVADAYVSAASLQSGFLDRLASQEIERARRNREMEIRLVDPAVFDQQTEDIKLKLDSLASFKDPLNDEMGRAGWFPIRLTGMGYKKLSFYYERLDGRQDNYDYRMVLLPEKLFNLIAGAYYFCKSYKLYGRADSSPKTTSKGQKYLQLSISAVQEINTQTDIIKKRETKRQQLEEANWMARISDIEQRELRSDAAAGERRAEKLLTKRLETSSSAKATGRALWRLVEVDGGLAGLGISRSSNFPTGMRFVSNPDYAACLSAFKKVCELFERGGLDLSKLEDISCIGILHASDIYEKWCLLKIFMLLMHDFKFKPERGWEEKLVATSLARASNARFEFSRDDLQMKVALTCQADMPTGRRPDFVLEVIDTGKEQSSRFDRESGRRSGIVMDAKFRSIWRKDGLRRMLDELVLAKGYDKAVESGRVFILQPCESTVRSVTSPLEWGAHCDYGSTQSHRQGWIQAGVTSSGARSTQHLKRLLAMVFQKAFPEPLEESDDGKSTWIPHSFCIGCGERHTPTALKKEKSGWLIDCGNCGMRTKKTHCYSCKTPLFKNGTLWTYHNTVADQVTNVICPSCGSYFDAEFS